MTISNLLFLFILGLFCSTANAQYSEVIKLLASDDSSNDFFGLDVAIYGDQAVVGAMYESGTGAAYVYELVGGTWVETQKLTPSDGTTGDNFGGSVSITTDRILIGSQKHEVGPIDPGAAYVYDLVGGTWVETQKLTASDSWDNDNFGVAVSIEGDRALIGADQNDDNGSSSGSAYVFDLSGGTWTETQKLIASDGVSSDFFGSSVSLSGDMLVIGARTVDNIIADCGAAYMFESSGGTWTETQKLFASDPAAGDNFAESVSLSGNNLAIGAPAKDDNGNESGAAYIFGFSGGTWTEVQKITASDAAASDYFGKTIAISGDVAVVGAFWNDDNGGNSGSAYILELNGGVWSETQKITASDAAAGDYFGSYVGVSGENIIVGSPRNDDGGSQSGSAYIFKACTPTTAALTISACDSYTVPSGDETYTALGTSVVMDTITNGCGADSIMTITLTINESTTGTDVQTACDSYTWIDGNTYTTSNTTATHVLTNAAGCDSVVTLNLTINNSSTSTSTVTECDSYLWNGSTYTTSGTYTWTGVNAVGCDSVATLDLTINNATTSTSTVTECDSYAWNGTTYTTSGTYTWTGVNAVGCDSVATLNLTINNATTSTSTVTECESYAWNGTTYTTSGTYTWTGVNAVGCDSVATLNLTINNATTSTSTVTECDSYAWNGTTYTISGTYTWTGVNAVGCDSVATLNLTINNATTSTSTVAECGSYAWNGTTYTTSGTYTWTGVNAVGCDSVATLNLTINNATTSISTVTECDSYVWNGTTYTTSGTYTWTGVNAVGCDSVATLNLTINNATTSTSTVTECESYTWNGTTYTTSGTYTWTGVNSVGCDSIATLNLTINTTSSSTHSVTACGSENFEIPDNGIDDNLDGTTDEYLGFQWIDGNYYTSSNNSATHTLTNQAGCDSVVTLDLIVLPPPTISEDFVEACESYTWVNGTTYTSSVSPSDNVFAFFTAQNGCDSLMLILDLTINSVDVSTTNTSPVLSANVSGATYQWIDCDNGNAPISGATDQTFTASQNGNYAVIVTDSNCSDTSACMLVDNVGITSLMPLQLFEVYPNPSSNGRFTIITEEKLYEVNVFDLMGRKLDVEVDLIQSTINGEGLERGEYRVQVITESGKVMQCAVIVAN